MLKIKTLAAIVLGAAIALPMLPASAAVLTHVPYDKVDQLFPRKPTASSHVCGEGLVQMRRVNPDDLANVTRKRNVWVTEICSDGDLGISPNEGNVASIRSALVANEVIMEKLYDRNFTEGDVVAVKMINEDVVQLFVAYR